MTTPCFVPIDLTHTDASQNAGIMPAWIPAFACLQQAGRNDEGGYGQAFVGNGKGAVGMMTNPFRPPRIRRYLARCRAA